MNSASGDSGFLLFDLLRDSATDVIGTLGVAIYLGSYLALQLGLIRGNGWLFPVLNLAAALSLIATLMDPFNLYAMAIEVAWVAISIIGLTRLYIVHRYFRFRTEETAAIARLVPGLAKDRARRLLALGAWRDLPPGHALTRQGQPVTHLVFVASGVCGVLIDGAAVATLGTGALVGEMTYHTGEPATATVTVDAPARVLSFERRALESFLVRNDDIRGTLEQSVASDLRRKLASISRARAGGPTDTVPG